MHKSQVLIDRSLIFDIIDSSIDREKNKKYLDAIFKTKVMFDPTNGLESDNKEVKEETNRVLELFDTPGLVASYSFGSD